MVRAVDQGYIKARAVRRQLGVAPTQPIDPAWVATNLGLLVAYRPFEARRVFGLHYYDAETDQSLIVVNSTDPVARQRFTLAHEIAHSIFEPKQLIVDSEGKQALAELRANCFAGELLMPGKAIEAWKPRFPWSDSPDDVAALALHYGLSYTATLYRLKSWDILSAGDVGELTARWKELDQEMRSRLNERGEEQTTLPAEFVAVAARAFDQKKISRGKLDELLRGDITP